MTKRKIEWADPQPDLRRSIPEFWEAIHARPGEWAVYPGPNRNTTQINRRRVQGGKYEAVQRNGQMHVRFVKK
jgi:hypothetical protein